ncbi:MAG TPA: M55 family metallopeptidase [Thermomicrobiales bacterium]|jgi:D-amino peptidase|nr:M55 family metallopeptidase [Thermomicrobiales bacterium]
MRIYILTDQEGVAGVVNSVDYASPGSRYYETARRLLTEEVNAAIEGALAGGATEIFVLDGHGHGSIDVELLHPAAAVLTGRPIRFPFGFDASFDALVFVGQHAKSNTDGGHLSHTGSMDQDDLILNRRSVGELGWYIQLAGHHGKPTILVTGDQAVCDEARALVPEIETVAVKTGIRNGPATGLTGDENRLHNAAAVHRPPAKARAMIREAAERAVRRIGEIPPFFIEPPYELVSILRANTPGGERSVALLHADDFVALGCMPREHTRSVADIPFALEEVR